MLLKTGVLSLFLLLVSRVLGLLRESAQAAAFGTTGMGDVAVLMLTLPDWLTGVIASGSLAYVLLPHWATQNPHQQAQTQRRVASGLLLLGAVLAVMLFALQSTMAQVLLSGLPEALMAQAGLGLALSVLALPAAMLAALWVIRLQHEQDFTGMLAANLVVNAVLIVGLLLIGVAQLPLGTTAQLALALWLAMGLRLVWLRARLQAFRIREPHQREQTHAGALPHLRIWLWAAISAGLPITLPFVARTFASGGGEGALATFNYAWKLVELPLMLAIQLVATLLFPTITRAISARPGPPGGVPVLSSDAIQAVRGAFLLAWTLACAAIAGLQLGALALASMLFGWGRMPAESVTTLAAWSTIGAWSLLPQAVIAVALTVLATLGRMRSAAAAYAIALLALMAIGAWSHGDGVYMMAGLGAILSFVALVSLLAMRQGASVLPWRPMAVPLLTMLVFTLAARLGWLEIRVLKGPVALFASVLAALGVVAVTYVSSRELRATLRR